MPNEALSKETPTLIKENENLKALIKRIADFLISHLAISGVAIYFFNTETNQLHLLIESLSGHRKHMRKVVQFSDELLSGLYQENQINKLDSSAPMLINDFSKLKFTQQVFKMARGMESSSIRIPIKIDGNCIIYISIYTIKKNYFTQQDVDFCMLLREPLNIALSNICHFEETENSKEIDGLQINDPTKTSSVNCLNFVVGSSPIMRNVLELVNAAATVDSTILILGETGVGKELIANQLHYSSNRKEKPFIKINCGAIPESLIDSELFGHEKGSFTGAVRTQEGCFERADGGAVFLDEVGELSLTAQTKLLRVLQFREIMRVGGTAPIKLNIRIIAATHRDLGSMVNKGLFRKDLWFRLNVFPITIPPLRERKEDIPLFMKYLVGKKCAEMNIHRIPDISSECIAYMQDYDWPGNVREIENYVERGLIMCQGSNTFNLLVLPNSSSSYINEDVVQSSFIINVNDSFSTLDELNKKYIEHVLQATGGTINGLSGAAKILGINPNTLRSRMVKLNISSKYYMSY